MVDLFDNSYVSREEYDSVQNALPPAKKDGWLKRKFYVRLLKLNEEFGDNSTELMEKIGEKFLHSFPQIFFISLPLIALLLKLLYVRRKTFYYVDHVIYLIHVYCAMFIFMFLLLALKRGDKIQHLSWLTYLMIPVWIYVVWYVYKSMRNFYAQRRGKLFLNSLLCYFFHFSFW